jgi:cytochrome c biogenesis protein CcmG, thiol:disulfide interchange protein DsbE
MGALTLGPLVLSLDRAYAGLGFLVLIVAAEVWARRGRPEVAAWAWRTAVATFVGARLGFVLTHLDDYAAAPWTILAIWQGGFAPWWGVALGAAHSALEARRHPALRSAAPALGAAALLAWWLPAGLLTPAAASAGVVLPRLTLTTLAGEPVSLAASGTPTVVNVWATWCPPCRRELPLLVAAAAATPDVRVLLVNQGEGAATVRTYLEAQGLPGTACCSTAAARGRGAAGGRPPHHLRLRRRRAPGRPARRGAVGGGAARVDRGRADR